MTKQQTRSDVLAMYTPHRIPCPTHPKEVQNTVRATKTVQFDLSLAGGTSTEIDVATIASAVPGGLTYWRFVRINLIRVWGPSENAGTDSGAIRVDCDINTIDSPSISWTDSGTGGQQRSRVAFALGLREQSTWFGVASTTNIFNVRHFGLEPAVCIVQASVELLSPNLS